MQRSKTKSALKTLFTGIIWSDESLSLPGRDEIDSSDTEALEENHQM